MKPPPVLTSLVSEKYPQAVVFNFQCRRQISTATLLYTQRHERWHNQRGRPIAHSTVSSRREASSSAFIAPRKYRGSKTIDLAKGPSPVLPPEQKPNPKLNPPPETYAPPLDVPSQKPGQGKLAWLWSCGRAYITFYKTGVSNVRATARIAKSLREKASAGGGDSVLTRAEWQVVRRSRRDIARLPAFAVILLVFGEWTPLLALWMTPIIPEACRIPKQVEKEEQKRLERIRERQMRLSRTRNKLRTLDPDRAIADGTSEWEKLRHNEGRTLSYIDEMEYSSLIQLSTNLSAHSWAWEYFMNPPKSVLRWGLKKRLAYLKKDDRLIERDGGWQGLNSQEVRRACIERGAPVLRKNEAEMRQALGKWYGDFKQNKS